MVDLIPINYRVRALNARRQSMHAHHQNENTTTARISLFGINVVQRAQNVR